MLNMTKNYKQDPNTTNWPWVESPFFYDLLENQELSEEQKNISKKFHEDGYVVLDLNLTDTEIDELRSEINYLNNKDNIATQDNGYHYSKGKRIFEGWKESKLLHSLSMNSKVIDTLKMLYLKNPYPFQTITFNYGSNQPLHSDLIHFDTIPHRWLTAVWVALEDMTDQNGSLVYVPNSHKLPIFDFYDLKITVPEYGKQFDSYAQYEDFVRQLVETSKLEVKPLHCKKGQALIWAANLIHGGDIIRDPNSTRYSQVTHYYYDDCDVYYSPMFSEAWKGKFSHKKILEKNIREHKF
jgi:ectoine hydroxylase-related dioxygenase (phytanoyl-CoA dioxygenase family)